MFSPVMRGCGGRVTMTMTVIMRFVRITMHFIARFVLRRSAADAKPHAKCVVRSESRGQDRDPSEEIEIRIVARKRLSDDRVFREVARAEGECRQAEAADQEGPTDDAEALHIAKARHLAQIELPRHAVHDRAAAKEEQRLEECMGEDVIHRAEAGADAEA